MQRYHHDAFSCWIVLIRIRQVAPQCRSRSHSEHAASGSIAMSYAQDAFLHRRIQNKGRQNLNNRIFLLSEFSVYIYLRARKAVKFVINSCISINLHLNV